MVASDVYNFTSRNQSLYCQGVERADLALLTIVFKDSLKIKTIFWLFVKLEYIVQNVDLNHY